jgi:hypothetical protein
MFYVIAALLAMILLVQVVMLFALRDYTPAFDALRQQMAMDAARLQGVDQFQFGRKIDEVVSAIDRVDRSVKDMHKSIRGLDESLDKLLKDQTSDLFTGLDQVRQAVDSLSIDLAIRSG